MEKELLINQNIATLSKVWPKKKSIIFYTPGRFEGNLKYSFLYINAFIKKYKIPIYAKFLTLHAEDYFILRKENLPVIYWQDKDGKPVKALLDAAIVIEDGFLIDSSPTPSQLYSLLMGAIKINLWHGTPIKKIHLQLISDNFNISYHMSAIFKYCASVDLMCLASKNHFEIFKNAFISKEYKITGYPRNDILKREISKVDLLNVDAELLSQISLMNDKRIFLYAPTWRDGNLLWLKKEKITELAEIIKGLNGVLILNPHPFERNLVESNFQNLPGLLINNGYDIYPIMKFVDVLITDYSSILFDFMLLNRPIILYRPDHKSYIKESRDLIDEQENNIKLFKVESFDDLEILLRKFTYKITYEQKKLKSFHNKYNDKNASKRVVVLILKKLKFGISSKMFYKIKTIFNKNYMSDVGETSTLKDYKWDFRIESEYNNLILIGFSNMERWGCWTVGNESIINFPQQLPLKMLIMVHAEAFGQNRNLPILFSVGLAKISVNSFDNKYIFEVNTLSIAKELRIYIPAPSSPLDEGEGDDSRKLGICIRQINILDLSNA